jgi:tRNA A37 threonylcarbamoyladenosine modification protein TsaB
VFSLGVPLVGVPTTHAIAAHTSRAGRPVLAVMAAGRGRVVWSHHADGAIDGPHNTTVEELAAVAHSTGALVASEAELPGIEPVLVLPAGARVEQIARIGLNRLRAGERGDPARLEPIYAHGKRTREALPA